MREMNPLSLIVPHAIRTWPTPRHVRPPGTVAPTSAATSFTVPQGRWIILVVASLGCAVVLAPHGVRDETAMVLIGLAALLSSIAGFAFSGICGAMLFHLYNDPVQVVQLMITCSIANQATMTWDLRREINQQDLMVFLAGGVPGLAAGIWVLLHADRMVYLRLLGVLLIAYGSYMMLRKPVVLRRQRLAYDLAGGFLGGVTGGAAGFPGASVAILCSLKGWGKARQRGLVQPFILIMQVVALPAISLVHRSGPAGIGMLSGNLAFVPASLLGTSIGLALYRRMSDIQFTRALQLALIVAGVSYVF